jgi:SOS response regulatory protein OraA/RecX
VALRLLRHRDRSVAQLDRELEARGVGDGVRAEALATLSRTGLVDDTRFAGSRARGLSERGAGDRLVRHDLAAAGVAPDAIEEAIDALEPESERAARIVARRGMTAKTARYLAAKGFSDDLTAAIIARGEGEALG